MISILKSSKSLCATNSSFERTDSGSLSDQLPKFYSSKSCENLPQSSSSASCSTSYSSDSSINQEISINLIENTANTQQKLETNHLNLMSENCVQSKEKILVKIDKELQNEVTIKRKHKKKLKKSANIKKKIDMTKELAMFRVRRSVSYEDTYPYEEYEDTPNETDMDSENMDIEYDSISYCDLNKYFNIKNPIYLLTGVKLHLIAVENDFNKNQIELEVSRNKKKNKHLSVKKLLKSKDLSTCLSNRLVNIKDKNSIFKNNFVLHIKYDIYKKFESEIDSFIHVKDRIKCLYSTQSIDKRAKLTQEAVNSNKTIYKQIKNVDFRINNRKTKEDGTRNGTQQAFTEFTIDHGRVNNELNENYDDMYVQFLISLQHREITPEDYEYLSRLDELIKKKTVNDNLLKNFKTDEVTELMMAKLESDEEVCGICLDSYSIGQFRKYLPCGHRFHNECIEQWLKKQSTNCPLDNMPVDGTQFSKESQMNVIQYSRSNTRVSNRCDSELCFDLNANIVEEEIRILLNSVLDEIGLRNDIENLLNDLCDKVEVNECLNCIIETIS